MSNSHLWTRIRNGNEVVIKETYVNCAFVENSLKHEVIRWINAHYLDLLTTLEETKLQKYINNYFFPENFKDSQSRIDQVNYSMKRETRLEKSTTVKITFISLIF